jgi:anti-anti-sigma factor
MSRRGPAHGESEVRIAQVADGVGIVSLLGEHDLWTAAEVRNTLASLIQKGVDVVVDLGETQFIDSSIIHALEESKHLALQHGKRVSFQLETPAAVERVLELTGVLKAWPVYGTRAEAINAVRLGPI